MSELETKSPAPANGSGDNECLQKQLNILLVGLIVLSATVGVFLWRQVHYLRKDLEATRPLYNAMMQSMAQERPVVDAFAAKLADYARKHPDFAPIAQKYQLLGTNGPATTKPAASAPAAPAGAKPTAAPAPAPKK